MEVPGGVEGNKAAASRRVHEIVEALTGEVVAALTRRAKDGRVFHIEDVQDQVELALMRGEHQKVARAYVLYREEHAKARADKSAAPVAAPALRMADGAPLDEARLATVIAEASDGLDGVVAETILTETHRNLYDGISADEIHRSVSAVMRVFGDVTDTQSWIATSAPFKPLPTASRPTHAND